MKKMLLPMLALVVAVSLSAFTNTKDDIKKRDGQLWYEFVGTNDSDPGDYVLAGGDGSEQPQDCDNTSEARCAVLAEEGTPGHPDLADPDIMIINKTQQ
jgi:hypothetical protein